MSRKTAGPQQRVTLLGPLISGENRLKSLVVSHFNYLLTNTAAQQSDTMNLTLSVKKKRTTFKVLIVILLLAPRLHYFEHEQTQL